jgi:hypothetical protein
METSNIISPKFHLFRTRVLALTAQLRKDFELEVVDESFETNGDNLRFARLCLGNEFVHIRFVAGAPRDEYVTASVAQVENGKSDSRKSLNLKAYASKLGVRDKFFPESMTDETRGLFYGFGSPVQLVTSVIFLSVHCEELLSGLKLVADVKP